MTRVSVRHPETGKLVRCQEGEDAAQCLARLSGNETPPEDPEPEDNTSNNE